MNQVHVGDKVWSRVYGFGIVRQWIDFDHVAIEADKEIIVVHNQQVQKLWEA
jgi:hypothetical protein